MVVFKCSCALVFVGVHSAMRHDHIMQSSNPDYMLVEYEAERVARSAARALQASRQQCMASLPTGVPTWTGQNGLNPVTRYANHSCSCCTYIVVAVCVFVNSA